MSSPSPTPSSPPPGPPRSGPPAPTLVAQVKKVVGTLTTAGVGPGGPDHEITIVSAAAARRLLRELGTDAYLTLHTLLLMATDDGERLVINATAEEVGEELGWSRQTAGKRITALEEAGFLERTVDRTGGTSRRGGGGVRKGSARIILCPALYRPAPPVTQGEGTSSGVVAKTNIATAAVPVGVVAEVNIATESVLPRVVAETNIADPAPRSAGGSAVAPGGVTTESALHEDEMNEDHSFSSVTGARLTPPPMIGGLPTEEVVSLLVAYGMTDAEQVVAATDPAILAACLQEVEAGVGTKRISNPGGYLRKLVRDGGPTWFRRGTAPRRTPQTAPAASPQTAPAASASLPPASPTGSLPSPTGAGSAQGAGPNPAPSGPATATPSPRPAAAPAVPDAQLLVLLDEIGAERREILCRRAGFRATAGDALAGELASRSRRVRLIEELRRDGLL